MTRVTSLDQLDDAGWGALQALGRAFHVRDSSLQATLEAILAAAVDRIDGADFAGVNTLRRGTFEPQAVQGREINELDALEKATGDGPCIEAARSQSVVHVRDMADERRWPRYVERARSLGVRSMMCVPMWVDDERLGSISLQSRAPGAFGLAQERTAELLAVHASVALVEARRRDNLATALQSRDIIGQAKGILMERNRITAEDAFELLSTVSQRRNRKLTDIAEQVARTGSLPD